MIPKKYISYFFREFINLYINICVILDDIRIYL